MAKKKMFTPWSSLDQMLGKPPYWWPVEEQQRVASYDKYDQMYWNDPTQYAIRVLEDEQPLYVPNARIIVDTTAQWLMKGLQLASVTHGPAEPMPTAQVDGVEYSSTRDERDLSPDQKKLEDFLKRERFYSKFNINKSAGITRGDSAFHVTADPSKPEGSRVSVDTLHPGQVYRVWSDDDPDKVIRIHIVEIWVDPKDEQQRERIRKLTYDKVGPGHPEYTSGNTVIYREEAIYEISEDGKDWHGPTPKLVKQILPREALPSNITQIPVYWFPNIEWESQDYGSSELRGLEFLEWAVSQGCTDTQMALALEGLGVYATDGGRPVDDAGGETHWEVVPGGVMEVPAGSYFRRVEGVGSITPMMDQLKYIETKMYSATGLTDVALGQVDVQVAQSGVALAIKFMPTLARIENRDTAHVEILQQMFFDLREWFNAYDRDAAIPEVDVLIAKSKLPVNRVDLLNELNNMLDRKIISRRYYRERMAELGHIIPADEDRNIMEEAKVLAQINALAAPPGLQENAEKAAAGQKPITNANGGNNEDVDNSGNQSNNRNRPNESGGTEATQTSARQARKS